MKLKKLYGYHLTATERKHLRFAVKELGNDLKLDTPKEFGISRKTYKLTKLSENDYKVTIDNKSLYFFNVTNGKNVSDKTNKMIKEIEEAAEIKRKTPATKEELDAIKKLMESMTVTVISGGDLK